MRYTSTMPWTLPNVLTFARLLAAPMLVVVFLALPRPSADWTALGIFLVAALTDYVDGALARRWGQLPKRGLL